LEKVYKQEKLRLKLKTTGKPVFEELYSSPEKLKAFLNAMEGIQLNNFIEFANKFDFSKYKTLCDMGGASALLTSQIALYNEHMTCTVLDLPQVEPVANEKIQKLGLSNRVKFVVGDFLKDDFPKADIITMGLILHDWNLENKKILIKKA
jgi:predicted RNA methylase